MRVTLTLDPFGSAGGGSHSFARVLGDALPAHGMTVSFDPDAPADVVVVFAQHATPRQLRRHRARGARILHRLDERLDPHEDRGRRLKHRRIAALNALADVTIFQSAFVRDNVGPMCRAPRSRVIHNGVDTRVFAAHGARTALAGSPAVLHVSWSVGESKRLDRIGELLSTCGREARVYCAGRHAESGQPWLRDPRVIVLGARSRDEIAALMRGADFLFFPSEMEPCPNTPLEAIASGLPPLYHPSGGTPELLGDAAVAMTDDLAADVARLLGARDEFRARALERSTGFTAERATREYAEAMREAVATPVRPEAGKRRAWILRGF